MSKNNVSVSKCFLEVDDPFGFLGHVVAGRSDVRWSALSDKLLSNAALSSFFLVSCAWLGPPPLSLCLLPLPTTTHTTCMFFLPEMCVCALDNCVSTWTSSKAGRASQLGCTRRERCYNLECLLVTKCGPGFYLDLPGLVLCKQPGILLMDPLGTEWRGQKWICWTPVGRLKWYQEQAEI